MSLCAYWPTPTASTYSRGWRTAAAAAVPRRTSTTPGTDTPWRFSAKTWTSLSCSGTSITNSCASAAPGSTTGVAPRGAATNWPLTRTRQPVTGASAAVRARTRSLTCAAVLATSVPDSTSTTGGSDCAIGSGGASRRLSAASACFSASASSRVSSTRSITSGRWKRARKRDTGKKSAAASCPRLMCQPINSSAPALASK